MTKPRHQTCRAVITLLAAGLVGVCTPWVDAQTAVLVPAIPPIFPEDRPPEPAVRIPDSERLASIRSLESELPFPALRSEPLPVAIDPNAASRNTAKPRGTGRLPTVVETEQPPPAESLRIARRPVAPPSDPPRAPTVTPVEQATTVPSLRPFPEEKPIYEIGLSLKAPEGTLPRNVAQDRFLQQSDPWDRRPWGQLAYCWDAPVMSYHPLYYQDINLERHGYAFHPCLRPVVSGAHFFASTIALPYNATMHPPWEHVYPLGQYRPGSHVPAHVHWPAWDPKAAAAQGGVVAGAILLIP